MKLTNNSKMCKMNGLLCHYTEYSFISGLYVCFEYLHSQKFSGEKYCAISKLINDSLGKDLTIYLKVCAIRAAEVYCLFAFKNFLDNLFIITGFPLILKCQIGQKTEKFQTSTNNKPAIFYICTIFLISDRFFFFFFFSRTFFMLLIIIVILFFFSPNCSFKAQACIEHYLYLPQL